jgi:carbon monoxide dehydrogenase subunit G
MPWDWTAIEERIAMKVQLEKSFALAAGADAAWALLQDMEAVAACMPGARLTERVDEHRYKGTVTVKMGPASMAFRGELELREVDPAARTLRMLARGTDQTGSSGAAMDLHARIEEVSAGSCRLVGSSEVSVSGKAAAFGGRLMQGVADQVLQQFAANFAQKLPTTATAAPLPQAEAAAQARELGVFALAWAMVREWAQHVFPARGA